MSLSIPAPFITGPGESSIASNTWEICSRLRCSTAPWAMFHRAKLTKVAQKRAFIADQLCAESARPYSQYRQIICIQQHQKVGRRGAELFHPRVNILANHKRVSALTRTFIRVKVCNRAQPSLGSITSITVCTVMHEPVADQCAYFHFNVIKVLSHF